MQHTSTMSYEANRAKSLKNTGDCSKPYYMKELVPYVVERSLFQPEDVGHLGKSADHIGMGKIRAKTSIGKYVVEFLSKATIHGLNHICAPHRHFIERILAVLFVGMSLQCTVMLSLYSWDRYQHNASTMILDYNFETFEITKPAVTICLYERVEQSKFPEVFAKFGIRDTREARDFFLFISKPSYLTLNQTPAYTGTPPEKWMEVLRDLYVDFELKTLDVETGTEAQLTSADIVTERGMCTTVFGTYGDYSSLDYWLSNNWTVLPERKLPAWTYSSRFESMEIKNIPGPNQMAFHLPNEQPGYHMYRNNQSGVVRVKITVQRARPSVQLRKLSSSQRPCNVPKDGNLKMWPVYTRNLCLMECRFNLMRDKCGCYPHFARPTKGTPVCNVKQLHCIGNMAASVVSMNINGSRICKCPVNCDAAKYAILTTENIDGYGIQAFGLKQLQVSVDFPNFILYYEVIFGFNDFLVSVGGAAGLLFGASVISFIEILYHLTLRLLWYKKSIPKDVRGIPNKYS